MDPEAYAKHNKPEVGAAPGVYTHPDSKEELHADSFPAADAFVRQGWVYNRPLPSPEERRKASASSASAEGGKDEVAELKKQLKAERAARTKAEKAAAEKENQSKEAEGGKTPDGVESAEVVGQNQGTQPADREGNK